MARVQILDLPIPPGATEPKFALIFDQLTADEVASYEAALDLFSDNTGADAYLVTSATIDIHFPSVT